MKTGFVILLMGILLLDSSWVTKGDLPLKASCQPGFSQSFYTLLVSRDVLQGRSILKVGFFNLPLCRGGGLLFSRRERTLAPWHRKGKLESEIFSWERRSARGERSV
ncbi:hypothetical protein AALO_G00049690 [Alosa alosa]|uniref:Cadherin prodomain domain-containing protein n=1 Tax=Alosa alosa TaxID=278164 RepID=A0AAV6H711_9TELE|nr:hypothetical protein AALO_G00049690 [Alosa alosa]